MTKEVLLSISGLQFAAQDEKAGEPVEPVEVITAGDYDKKTTYEMSKEEFMNRVQSAIENREK